TLLGLFFLVSCATNSSSVAGSVNGTEISLEDFFNSYRGHYAIFGYQTGRTPTKEEKEKLHNETWRDITKAIILQDYYKKYNISASVAEVLDTLSNSIPEHIVKSPRFQVNGKFDKKLYLQSLMTDQPENLAALRKHYQENVIPILKLQKVLIEEEMLSSKIRKQVEQIIASNADLELYIFAPSQLEISLSDAEISAWYQTNLEQFRLWQFYRLGYCSIPVIPDSTELSDAKNTAEFIRNELARGIEIKDIIANLENKNSLVSFIDNGYQKTEELPWEVQNALSGLENGRCSEPLPYEKGWIMYQKIQSTKTLTLYNTIFVQALPKTASLLAPETQAQQIMKLALNIGLQQAADEFGISYTLTPAMSPDSLIVPANDIKGKLMKYLEIANSGDIIEPLYSAELSAWLIFEVVEKQSKEYLPLEEVKPQIVQILSKERRKDQNKQIVERWLINQNIPANYQWEKLEQVTIDSLWQGKPLTRIYYQAVKAYLEKANPPQITEGEVIIVPKVTAFRPQKTKISPERIKTIYTQNLPEDWFNSWMEEQVKKAKVVINTKP
ncbi:MAG TPA: peptidylprolyl isomerase, partial [Candidatus Cloacimonas acidaminovorans]|nr:peptidylprolyl isomerase [Candidatus Cloacimonas acidaminovorans]